MGYEFITQPQVFTSGITALGGIQGEVLKYPQIISYRSWTDTIVANTTSISIPGAFAFSDSSEAYIVNIGGVVQFPNTYTITGDRKINFNSVLSAGIEYGITLLATASPSTYGFSFVNAVSGNFTNVSAVNTYSNNLTAENLFVTYLTALSSNLNIVNITQYELSGFSVYGNANIHGNVIVSNLLSSLNTQTTNTSATNLTALNIFIRRNGSVISETSQSTINAGTVNVDTLSATIVNIGKTTGGVFTGVRAAYDENLSDLVLTSQTGSATLTSAVVDAITGQVAISGVPAVGQALTVNGSLSARDLRIVRDVSAIGALAGESLTISTGNVGIGITAPQQRLTVVGNISATGDVFNGGNFLLPVNGSAISSTSTPGVKFFGTSSDVILEANSKYELEFHLYYSKSTAGTVSYALTGETGFANVVANYIQHPVGGLANNGAMTGSGIVGANASLFQIGGATASLTTGVNHYALVRALIETSSSPNRANLAIWQSAGTLTPLRGSYWIEKRIN